MCEEDLEILNDLKEYITTQKSINAKIIDIKRDPDVKLSLLEIKDLASKRLEKYNIDRMQ
ncbi:hypothetical protein [uncultured Clostridium sp.]|uniref:hypothetical protein n=1 Tax=uncultured Clostridium sp. TaxID=59620 RepID=UPI0025911635|nr:hypothetical protein [uncultured Clostridium sp.]